MGLRLFIRKIFRGYSKRETPGSIPNPEAKTLRADGTALLWVWESRSSPLYYSIAPAPPGLFLFNKLFCLMGSAPGGRNSGQRIIGVRRLSSLMSTIEATQTPRETVDPHRYRCTKAAFYTRMVWLISGIKDGPSAPP